MSKHIIMPGAHLSRPPAILQAHLLPSGGRVEWGGCSFRRTTLSIHFRTECAASCLFTLILINKKYIFTLCEPKGNNLNEARTKWRLYIIKPINRQF